MNSKTTGEGQSEGAADVSSTVQLSGSQLSGSQLGGRWIRPIKGDTTPSGPRWGGEAAALSIAEVGADLLRETRKRLSGLAALERQLEDKIRGRWQEAEEEARRRAASIEEEIGASRKRVDAELKDLRLRSEREGRAAGFREGFARGREDGYRLGLEEGRRDGLREGQKEGREESSRQVEEEMAGAVAALTHAATALEEKRRSLLEDARRDLIALSLEIARKLVKREVERVGDVALRNVEEAVELIFRRGTLVIQVNPEDRVVIEKALKADPRWAEGFDAVEIRPAADLSPGGCRLVSGAGTVDMTIESQLGLIEEALYLADGEPDSSRHASAGDSVHPLRGPAHPEGGGG